jgi:hypothetical protein
LEVEKFYLEVEKFYLEVEKFYFRAEPLPGITGKRKVLPTHKFLQESRNQS